MLSSQFVAVSGVNLVQCLFWQRALESPHQRGADRRIQSYAGLLLS